jgi:hypothetical protein
MSGSSIIAGDTDRHPGMNSRAILVRPKDEEGLPGEVLVPEGRTKIARGFNPGIGWQR